MHYTDDFNYKLYYDKMALLKDQLVKSETERKILEARYQHLSYTKEDEIRLNSLKKRYAEFLEGCKERNRRNDEILKSLDRLESCANTVFTKTERLKQLRKHYDAYLSRAVPLWRHPDVVDLQGYSLCDAPRRASPLNGRPNLLIPGGAALMLPAPVYNMPSPAKDQPKTGKGIASLGEAGLRMMRELNLLEGTPYPAYLTQLAAPQVQYQPYNLPLYVPHSYYHAVPYPVVPLTSLNQQPYSLGGQGNADNTKDIGKPLKRQDSINTLQSKLDKMKEKMMDNSNKIRDNVEIDCLPADENLSMEQFDDELDAVLASRDNPLSQYPPQGIASNTHNPPKKVGNYNPKESSTKVAAVVHKKSIKELKNLLLEEPDDVIFQQHISSEQNQEYYDEDVPEDFNEQNFPDSRNDPRYQRDVLRNVILEEDEEEEERQQQVSNINQWDSPEWQNYQNTIGPNEHAAPPLYEENSVARRPPNTSMQEHGRQQQSIERVIVPVRTNDLRQDSVRQIDQENNFKKSSAQSSQLKRAVQSYYEADKEFRHSPQPGQLRSQPNEEFARHNLPSSPSHHASNVVIGRASPSFSYQPPIQSYNQVDREVIESERPQLYNQPNPNNSPANREYDKLDTPNQYFNPAASKYRDRSPQHNELAEDRYREPERSPQRYDSGATEYREPERSPQRYNPGASEYREPERSPQQYNPGASEYREPERSPQQYNPDANKYMDPDRSPQRYQQGENDYREPEVPQPSDASVYMQPERASHLQQPASVYSEHGRAPQHYSPAASEYSEQERRSDVNYKEHEQSDQPYPQENADYQETSQPLYDKGRDGSQYERPPSQYDQPTYDQSNMVLQGYGDHDGQYERSNQQQPVYDDPNEHESSEMAQYETQFRQQTENQHLNDKAPSFERGGHSVTERPDSDMRGHQSKELPQTVLEDRYYENNNAGLRVNYSNENENTGFNEPVQYDDTVQPHQWQHENENSDHYLSENLNTHAANPHWSEGHQSENVHYPEYSNDEYSQPFTGNGPSNVDVNEPLRHDYNVDNQYDNSQFQGDELQKYSQPDLVDHPIDNQTRSEYHQNSTADVNQGKAGVAVGGTGGPNVGVRSSVVNQLLDSDSESYQVEPAPGSQPADDSDFDFSIGK